MLNRLNLLLCACALIFLAACGGSKTGGGSRSSSYDGDDDSPYNAPAPKPNELKEAKEEAVGLTEENHKMAREIFELKNKLGLPTDE